MLQMTRSEHPVLSVVVAIVSDTTEARANVVHLADCLGALEHQAGAPQTEVIVPYGDSVDGIETLRTKYPGVRFLPVAGHQTSSNGGSREHHDILRARGMLAARGDLIALLEDHARPSDTWCATIVDAHREGYSAIGGAIENGIDRPLNWAVYYCDFGRYQNPVPSGETAFASDANTSYKRSALESVRALWEHSFREVVVNGALIARGDKIALRPDIVVFQHRHDLRLHSALRERFIWGRSYAITRCELLSNPRRIVYATLSPLLPLVMMFRIGRTAWRRRLGFVKFVGSVHFIALLLAGWSLGEGIGYLTGELPSESS